MLVQLLSYPAIANLVTEINPLERELIPTKTTGNYVSPADMQSLIDAAGDRSMAGVFDCETTGNGDIATVEPDYDVPAVTITGADRYDRNDGAGGAGFAFSSGAKFKFVNGSNTWTPMPKEDGDLVTHFSTIFSVWGSEAELTTVTATFTDDSRETFTSETASEGTTYQFVGFQAPAGLGIRSITSRELGGGHWLVFDHIAFVLNGDHSPSAEDARITAIRFDRVTVEVDYEGAPGVVYALDYSPDLRIWDGEIDDSLYGTGTATDNIVTRLGEAPPKGFYRLREIP